MRAIFPAEALEQVAKVIKARRRRSLAPEEARRRGFKPTQIERLPDPRRRSA